MKTLDYVPKLKLKFLKILFFIVLQSIVLTILFGNI